MTSDEFIFKPHPENTIMAKYPNFNPESQRHITIVEEIEDYLKEESDWVQTPILVSEVNSRLDQDYTDHYLRTLATDIRKYMKNEKGTIEIDSRKEGGQETIYWRIKN